MSVYAGIDPGLHGAIVTVSSGVITSFGMPISKGKGIHKVVDVHRLTKIVREIGKAKYLVEQPFIKSMKGAQCIFENFGMIVAVLDLEGMDYKLVYPKFWQSQIRKETGIATLGLGTKDLALRQALSLYPKLGFSHSLDGRVDALLMAHVCSKM